MTQIQLLRNLLNEQTQSDEVLQYYLDIASDIICELRFTDLVEPQYRNIQVQMAVELYSKRGAEGEISHSELGVSRVYASTDISPSLLEKVTQVVRTPYSTRKEVVT